MFIIDISVPRNVDPEINNIDNIYLYDIDDLQGVVDNNINGRKKESEKAADIIDAEVETFLKWYASLDVVPTVIALRERAEAIRKEELEKVLKKLDGLGERDIKAIESLTNSIVNKLIHSPTAALKSEIEDKDFMVDVVRRLFGLEAKKNSR